MPLPCAVGLQRSQDGPVYPALLLEWKRTPDQRGHLVWWALVASAHPSLAHPAIPFVLQTEWCTPTELVGLPEGLIWTGRR